MDDIVPACLLQRVGMLDPDPHDLLDGQRPVQKPC